jgi:hypothetical protein
MSGTTYFSSAEDISKRYYIAQNHLKQFTVRYEVMSLLEFYESNSKPEMWQIRQTTQKNCSVLVSFLGLLKIATGRLG